MCTTGVTFGGPRLPCGIQDIYYIYILFVFKYEFSYPMIRHNKRWVGYNIVHAHDGRAAIEGLERRCVLIHIVVQPLLTHRSSSFVCLTSSSTRASRHRTAFRVAAFACVLSTYVLDDSVDPGSVDPGKSSAELTALCMPTQQAPAVRFAVVCLGERNGALALVETR